MKKKKTNKIRRKKRKNNGSKEKEVKKSNCNITQYKVSYSLVQLLQKWLSNTLKLFPNQKLNSENDRSSSPIGVLSMKSAKF